MAIEYETRTLPGYFLIECTGDTGVSDFIDILPQLFREAGASGGVAAVLDIRKLRGPPPNTLERFEIGVAAADAQKQYGRNVQLAIVGHEPIVDPERFGEVVSSNRGANLRVFTDLAEAESWLAEEPAIRRPE